MTVLKLENKTMSSILGTPNGIYVVDNSMIASVNNGVVTYLAMPANVSIEALTIKEPETQGTVSEDFALKIAAMAFERDTVPTNGGK